MSGMRRSKSQIARDRRKIANLYLQGRIQADIGEELDINQSTVSRDLQALQEEWKNSSLIDIDEAKAKELAKVDRLEREYWDAWERSCLDEETTRLEGTLAAGEEKGKTTKQVVTRKGQAGDPRFLTGIQWCIERRCKILGIDAPAKQEHGGLGGGPIQVAIEDMNETRKRLLESVQKTLVSDEQSPEEEVD